MKIAQVVTFVSSDGSFGGPTRVALGQAEALADRGHEVTVYSAAPAAEAGESRRDGYRIKTFPARRIGNSSGFATMFAPGLSTALRTDLPHTDVAHIHLARDLVTMPAARQIRRAKVPYVVQPHGMIDATDKLLAKPLDAFATRPVLREAIAVLALTDREIDDIALIEPGARSQRIANGIKVGVLPSYEGRDNVVLFLARLHERKRPLAFVRMAEMLRDELPETRFLLVGPDEGQGAAVAAAINGARMGDRLEWIGAVSPDRTDELLTSARAYVLPAFNEVFPMTILESLRVGTPVVTTDSLGIADACSKYGAAVITDGTPEMLSRSLMAMLVDDNVARRLRQGGLDYLRADLDIAHVAEALEKAYMTDRKRR